jgi:hypothetical protein
MFKHSDRNLQDAKVKRGGLAYRHGQKPLSGLQTLGAGSAASPDRLPRISRPVVDPETCCRPGRYQPARNSLRQVQQR